ncbi:MAG: DUF5320 domain-containing protein [Desulfohalobiaceae bacterium]
MPAGDRTGPMGMGPRTGRAAGYCSGFGAPGFANPMPGRGLGFGRGRGRGRGRGLGLGRGFCFGPKWLAAQFYAPWQGPEADPYQQMGPEQEKQMLQNEAQNLRNALANLEERIQELETQEQSQE